MLVKDVFKPSAIRFFTPFSPEAVADKDAKWLLDKIFIATYGQKPTKSQQDDLYRRVLEDEPECSSDGRWSAEELEWPLRESINW